MMNVGGGEAADQLVRMMLSGSEVAVRLSGSALKNLLALSMALAKDHKVLSGKVNMGKMLKETRDLRRFPMTPEQYKQFHKLAKKHKLLYSVIRDKTGPDKLVDIILPVTELDRANAVFERILYASPPEPEHSAPLREAAPPKKDSRSEQDLSDTRTSSSTPPKTADSRRTSDRPSIEERLRGFREQLNQKRSAPARTKSKSRPKAR